MENYSDIFRMQNNKNIECLISWHWDASAQPWTAQNSFQSDLGMNGFDEFGELQEHGYDGYYVIAYDDDGGAHGYGPYSSKEEAVETHGIQKLLKRWTSLSW